MTQDEKRIWLIEYLLKEEPAYSDTEIPADSNNQWLLLRSLMNIRPAKPIGKDFLSVQDEFLQEETRRKGIVDIHSFDCVHDGPYVSAAPSTRRVLDLATSVIHKEGKAS